MMSRSPERLQGDMGIVHGELPAGLIVRKLDRRRDDRGWFMEIFQNYWKGPIDPVQWSLVRSNARVLRGLHIHLSHDEYIMPVFGQFLVGLRDLRPDSPTRNRSCLLRLNCENPIALLFPRGLLHGWYFMEDSLHLQAVSESYHDYHLHDNLGCLWSDPALDLPWPDAGALSF
jgi:dTDP-4-dehydrorhamnose 3,5-epimerase